MKTVRNLIIFACIFVVVLGQIPLGSDIIKRQDPFLAGVLSWYMAGLGQIYAGDYFKGTVFWIVDTTLWISAILTVADINFSSNSDIGFQLNIKPKENITKKQETIAISLATGFVLFRVYTIIDAIRSVRRNNLELIRSQKNMTFLDFENDGENNYLGIHYRI
ncbi:MAG: hypothetical protein JW827_06225 [Spirochaetes bacterium]|nr:hypothetical protein [Spirochaetota bacterium]